ncbi:unnamed protein product, partial [Lymnaea stagnalis]
MTVTDVNEKKKLLKNILDEEDPIELIPHLQTFSDRGISIILEQLLKIEEKYYLYKIIKQGVKLDKIVKVIEEIGENGFYYENLKLLKRCMTLSDVEEQKILLKIVLDMKKKPHKVIAKGHDLSDEGISIIIEKMWVENTIDVLYKIIKGGVKLEKILQVIEDSGENIAANPSLYTLLKRCMTLADVDEQKILLKIVFKIKEPHEVISKRHDLSDDGLSIIIEKILGENDIDVLLKIMERGVKLEKIHEVIKNS